MLVFKTNHNLTRLLIFHITELDVSCESSCYASDVNNKQSQVFSNALKACLSNSCCTGFLVWGIGDKDSWLGADKKGLLFDNNYQPKSQYTALLSVLKTTKAASLGNKNNNNFNSNSNITPPVNNNYEETQSTTFKATKISDGWYKIKNPKSGLYLQVRNSKGADSQNVELGDDDSQMWKIKNIGSNYVTLTSSLGDFMLDVCMGDTDDGVNAQIYTSHGEDAQQFVFMETDTKNTYVIGTKN
ncbi:hypothetical protein BCR36DRAFT_579968 [Piromyces finnis]|uniref:GH10 domain-containing protein n=1 Tax=Piromyces finnis TaxID=1754191 RepID=A0A1Y1VJT2_9FUNG|nr:hypothetical protein BCR36DRAFT_579968 [Piromyces finnis]|eukprot:ORX58352.1 hypothetical protein BCR36DRAFT_579968 [Piromyces finnis]